MNRTAFLLALLLLFIPTYANIQQIIDDYTSDGESVDIREISTGFGDYTLITVNGADSMLVDNSVFELVEDPVVIYTALKEEYLSQNQVSVDIDNLVQKMADFNSSWKIQEALCKQYTGTDRLECKDFSTCRYSCLSVPLCRSVFEGQGDGFIYSIENWRARTKEIENLLGDYADSVKRIPETPEMANLAWDYLGGIDDKAKQIKTNKLFICDAGGYCFCYVINFTFENINESKQGLTDINNVLSVLPSIERKANIVASITEERINNKLANDEVYQYQKTYGEVKVNFTGTKLHVDSVLKLVDSELLSENITALKVMRDNMGALGEDKNYSGAVKLKDDYYSLAKKATVHANSLFSDYILMNASKNEFDETIQNKSNLSLIGGYFSKEYAEISENFRSAKEEMKPPVEETLLVKLKDNVNVLRMRLSALEVKAGKALELLDEAKSVEGYMMGISAKASEYQQEYNFQEIEDQLETARSAIEDGNLESGESFVKDAQEKAGTIKNQLDEKIPRIEEAKKAAFEADLYLGEQEGTNFLIFGTDFSRAKELCSNSMETRFSSPRDSIHYAQECRNSVDSELQGLEYKKYGLVIVVLTALVLFFLWARKREWGFVVG